VFWDLRDQVPNCLAVCPANTTGAANHLRSREPALARSMDVQRSAPVRGDYSRPWTGYVPAQVTNLDHPAGSSHWEALRKAEERWPDSGRTTARNREQRCEPMRGV
jgi:hypothetical protein